MVPEFGAQASKKQLRVPSPWVFLTSARTAASPVQPTDHKDHGHTRRDPQPRAAFG